ncbi:hypothetical protein OG554_35320 [Streptomyces griseus]|uniref:hypothetical protein n=1 Tax=Streptomyces griseus TaxID=1911 RepID=UPI00386F4520|nr:hypothetical protein OG554_35320 [Streptomyces fimicarius]
MPTSRPRKSRKRTREIRQQSQAMGTRYTEAMRANDRTLSDGQQLQHPAGILLPLVAEALAGFFELDGLLLRLRAEMVLDHEGVLAGYREPRHVPVPGAPIEDVTEAYWRVRDALPEGTEEFADGHMEEYPPTPNVLLLTGPYGGGNVVHLTTFEVADADLTLLTDFGDALDRATGLRPGSEYAALTKRLGEIGRMPYYPWMPEGDAATVARWARRALSTVLHSPFGGPRGEADLETLTNVLRYAEGWESVEVDEDEERAAERALMSVLHAALDDEEGGVTLRGSVHEQQDHPRVGHLATEELSFDEQEQLVVTLSTSLEAMPEDEFEANFRKLDREHQIEVEDAIRDFAAHAVGDENWDR